MVNPISTLFREADGDNEDYGLQEPEIKSTPSVQSTKESKIEENHHKRLIAFLEALVKDM